MSKLLSVISEYCQSFLNKTLLKADYLITTSTKCQGGAKR